MTDNALAIIEEYLARGYSLDALRLLAESREQPLAGEMLAALDAMAAHGGRPAAAEDSGPCETAAYPVARGEEEALFFVADDEEAVSVDAAVDFDVMAGTAAGEESVAEIFITPGDIADTRAAPLPPEGETDAAGAAASDGAAPEEAPGETGIWSRLWSRMAGGTAPAPSIREEDGPGDLAFENDSVAETPVEPVRAEAPAPAQTEISSDYIPGSVAEEVEEYEFSAPVDEPADETKAPDAVLEEVRRLGEAQAALAALGTETPPEQTAEDNATEAAAAPCAPSPSGKEDGISRRERRRRERAEKKRIKLEKKASVADALPEIVLTRAEGTECSESADETATREFAMAGAAEESEAEAPRMGEAMNLLTPNDIIDDDSRMEDGHNVILFNEKFPVFAGIAPDQDEEEDEADAGLFLRMLPAVTADDAEEKAARESDMPEAAETALRILCAELTDEESAESAETAESDATDAADAPREIMDDEARQTLIRAMLGVTARDVDGLDEPAAPEADGHAIISMEPEAAAEDLLAREAEARAEMELEYQARLDDFAQRILEAQARAAANETLLNDGKKELNAANAVIRDMHNLLNEETRRRDKLAGQLETARNRTGELESGMEKFHGMKEEHERLYKEFEDLRRAYNEVVTDVMPGLQTERDDLALTVERQCEGEEKLRSSLGSMRKRLAVGYSLGAAACLTLVALPLVNWIKSGQGDKELAMERQKISELQETLQQETRRNVDARNVIVELENKVDVARAQIADLQGKNKELARVSRQQPGRDQGLAVFKPADPASAGVPVRASDMALQATARPGGQLHVNEIRDPAGSIEQVVAMNRLQQTDAPDDSRLAGRDAGARARPVAVSAVARVGTDRRDMADGGASLRPGVQMAAATRTAPAAKRAATGRTAAPKAAAAPRAGEILAKVRKGEGVAQVVYRELGTWDPEIVAWVIRENKITTDKRGNPRIHPDQTLRLPGDGRVGQAASAAGRKR